MRLGGIGGGAGLVIALVVLIMGGNPLDILRMLEGGGGPTSVQDTLTSGVAPDDETGRYLSAILAMTEDVWAEIFAEAGARYEEPTLVLFSGGVQSACGYSSAATGPFYCPADRSLYLDTSFFQELASMGSPGDFAQAYVVGHEVGHHVQTLVGTSDWVRGLQKQSRVEADTNQLQVLMELQADCYAGVWANHANRRQQILERGDVQEGLAAAAAIGDDRLQRAGRSASPESFTHGSSEQRQHWLSTGLQSGDVDACDTFGEAGLKRPR
jgi:hypothetical protein